MFSGEEQTKTRGTSCEPDPSSSDLSADTVIYIGPKEEGTDGEHPPVYIPSLNSGDNRCSMSKVLRGNKNNIFLSGGKCTGQSLVMRDSQLCGDIPYLYDSLKPYLV